MGLNINVEGDCKNNKTVTVTELSDPAKKALSWLLGTCKAGEMKVSEARKFIRNHYGEDVEYELKEFAKIDE